MFQCLVIYINLVKIYYVHAQARYIYLATILRPNHVYSVRQSRVQRKSRFLEHSISRRQYTSAQALSAVSCPLLYHYYDGRVIQLELVKSQRKVYLLACLNYIILLQIIVMSVILYSYYYTHGQLSIEAMKQPNQTILLQGLLALET